MPKYEYLNINNNKIAYRYYKRSKKTVIFIHGLKSNMNGKKSIFLNQYCRKKNYSYLCFDFRGHGKSSGEFTDFGIRDWYEDLNKLITLIKKTGYFAIDTETNSLNIEDANLVGVSIAVNENSAYYIPVNHKNPEDNKRLNKQIKAVSYTHLTLPTKRIV